MHEDVSQRQISVGTLVSSQVRRALAVPLVNRGLTAGQQQANRGINYEVDCSCFRRKVQDSVFDSLHGKREGCFFARSSTPSYSAPPWPPNPRCPGPSPRHAPPRTDRAVVCPGFGFDKCYSKILSKSFQGHFNMVSKSLRQ